MKKTSIILCFLLLVTSLSASFLGFAKFHAKVIKIYHGSLKNGRVIKVKIRLISWIEGGGHRRTFGKRMVGKVRTINLRFKQRSAVSTISVGEIIPVRYRSISSMVWRKGRRVAHSSRSWQYMGKKIPGSSYRFGRKRIYHKSSVRIIKTYSQAVIDCELYNPMKKIPIKNILDQRFFRWNLIIAIFTLSPLFFTKK